MKKFVLITVVLYCIIPAFLSCSTDKREEEILSSVCSLVGVDPDSALVVLKGIPRGNLSQPALARYALIYVMAQDKSGLDVKDDSLLRIAREFYVSRPEDTLYASFCYYQGKYYTVLDSLKNAETYLWNAINSAERKGDKYTAYLASYQMSRVYSINDPRLSLAYAKKALSIYESMGHVNISNQMELLRKVGNSHYMLDENDSAMSYMNRALVLAITLHDSVSLGRLYHSISQVQLNMNRGDSALYYAQQAWKVSSERDPSLYTQLAVCYMGLDSLERAEHLLKTASCMPSSVYTRYTIYSKLLDVCLAGKQNHDAKCYSDSVQALLRRMYYGSESANTSFQKDNHELEKEKDEIETLFSKSVQYGLLVAVLVVLLIAQILYNYYNFRKHARLRLAYEMKCREQELRRSEAEHQKHLEIERLKYENEREKQNLKIANKEKQLSLMKAYFLLKSRYTLEGFKSSLRTNDLRDEDWLEIEIFLNETCSGFALSLRKDFPDLTEKDYRDCMLLKIGLTNFEMERFYGISNVAVKQRLLRLKNKLCSDLEDVSAREFIQSFPDKNHSKMKCIP